MMLCRCEKNLNIINPLAEFFFAKRIQWTMFNSYLSSKDNKLSTRAAVIISNIADFAAITVNYQLLSDAMFGLHCINTNDI